MIYIHGIGHFHPSNVIDNQFLEKLDIGTSDAWILERVGIRERHTVLSLDYISETYNQNPQAIGSHIQFTNAQTGAKAARMALEQANLQVQDIGMVIAGGCLPQYSMPADACAISAELGITAPAFDLNSACSTFAAHMHLFNNMQVESLPDYILMVISENVTRSINFRDRTTAVLWGDGTVAVVVSKKIKSRVLISHTILDSNPATWNKVVIPIGGYFQQEGSTVQKFAIKTTITILEQLQDLGAVKTNQHYFIGHQANLKMLESVCRIANIPEHKHLYNVDRFGNCGAAGAPSVLSQNWFHFKTGDTIIIVVVGAGFTWGGMIIQIN